MAANAPVTGVAIVGSHELQVAVNEAAAAIPALVLHVETARPEAALTQVGERAESADILLIDVPNDATSGQGPLAELCTRRAGSKVTIVSAAELDLNDARRLHRLGVFDVLPQPVYADDVRATFAAAVRSFQAGRRHTGALAPVIAFTRAKGGMGATTLATHAMLSLAGVGRRGFAGHRVGFLDLDIQFGDAGINLDIPASSGLLDLLNDPARLDAALLKTSMAERPEGVSILPAPCDLLPFEVLDPEVVGRMIDVAREEFDVVVLDLPLAITAWTRAVLERVHELVIVTALSVCGIRRSRRLSELLDQEGISSLRMSFALNRFANTFSERGLVKQSEKALGRGFDYRIANDYPLVAQSQDRGVPVFALKPRSRLARSLHEMADGCVARAREQMTSLEQADAQLQAAE